MDILPRIGRSERRELLQMARRSDDLSTALRFLIVARLGLRKTSCEVEGELGVARATVVRTAHRYAEQGVAGLYDKRRDNGNPKIDDAFRHRVVVLLRRTPEDVGWRRPTWTRELLCLQMTREGWPPVAVTTMGRVLARIGARIGVPKPVVLCPWKRDARERRLAEIRALEAGASVEEPVLYSDEVDIHLNPKIGRDWMLRGEQRRIVTPGKNEKFYLAGALDVRTGVLHTTGTPRKSAALFCNLLRLLASSYDVRVRRIHLIVDNYGIHSAHATRRVLKELGDRIVLHFLPPYCPDANRIERVWQDLHANVTRNHRCKTMKALLSNAREYLEGYVWRRITGVAPILSRAA
jgi:transposase